jgi:cell division septal protein FtsQ
MTSLIKMFVLIILLSSSGLISSFTDNNNYLDININYSSTGYFDNEKVVDSLIRNKELSDLINLNEFQKVEKELEKIKSIKSIDIFRNNYLQLEIDIIDREPIVFIRELNSYMDCSGVIIKKYNSSINSIPEIKGILNDGEEFKILKVISALENDDFFKNKLKSISLKGDDIYLNITGFDFDIRFGNEFQLKNKLNMLKGFYVYQFDNLSNKKYKQVDLVYNNRLIAIKN